MDVRPICADGEVADQGLAEVARRNLELMSLYARYAGTMDQITPAQWDLLPHPSHVYACQSSCDRSRPRKHCG